MGRTDRKPSQKEKAKLDLPRRQPTRSRPQKHRPRRRRLQRPHRHRNNLEANPAFLQPITISKDRCPETKPRGQEQKQNRCQRVRTRCQLQDGVP